MMRFNQLFPPFDNPAIRRALLGAVDQADFMTAVAGTDPTMWRDKIGFFPPGSPLASNVGMQALDGPRNFEKVKKDLTAAGYKGEKIVVMVATDLPVLDAMGEVGVDMLKKVGMNADAQETDWGRSCNGGPAANRRPTAAGASSSPVSTASISSRRPATWDCEATERMAGSAGRQSRSWRNCVPPGSPHQTPRHRRRSARKSRPRRSKACPISRWASISNQPPTSRRSPAS